MHSRHIKLQKGENIFFTSDMHFNHSNILRFCNRPWNDMKSMRQGLIDRWNSVVTNNDYVFNLGDFMFTGNDKDVKDIIDSLNGKSIYMIPGNHDNFKIRPDRVVPSADIVKLTVSAEDYKERGWKYSTFEIWLCHYPLMTWPHRGNLRCFHLFGHIHSQIGKNEGFDQDLPLHDNQYDVGVDRNNWTPVQLEELLIRFNLLIGYERQ